MTTTSRRIIRLPALLDKLGGVSKTTFFRRYRWSEDFPQPLELPDGGLAYWEDQVDAALNKVGYTDDPRSNVADLPAHWLQSSRSNQRSNPLDDDTDFPPQTT